MSGLRSRKCGHLTDLEGGVDAIGGFQGFQFLPRSVTQQHLNPGADQSVPLAVVAAGEALPTEARGLDSGRGALPASEPKLRFDQQPKTPEVEVEMQRHGLGPADPRSLQGARETMHLSFERLEGPAL